MNLNTISDKIVFKSLKLDKSLSVFLPSLSREYLYSKGLLNNRQT